MQAEQLLACGAVYYPDYGQMLREHPRIDLVAIATPIHLHKPMCLEALDTGCHVLVEKPPAVTVQDMARMIEAQRASGRKVQVNFQHTSSAAFRVMIGKLRSGEIGRLLHVTGIGKWSRGQSYYERTPWAGKLMHHGNMVLDGTLSNPFAHLLNNCLIAAGNGQAQAAEPTSVRAERYRAYEIEGDDTSCASIETSGGVPVRLYATLCHEAPESAGIRAVGDRGEMYWDFGSRLAVRTSSGRESELTFEPENLFEKMYRNSIEAILDPSVELYSPLHATSRYVAALNGALESAATVRPIAARYVRRRAGASTEYRTIEHISALIDEAADRGKLFSELSVPWAAASRPFDLAAYRRFQPPFIAANEARIASAEVR